MTQPTNLQLYFRLLRYLQPYWKRFVISLLCMTVAAGTEAAFASLMKPLLDTSFVKLDSPIWFIPLAILGLFIVRAVTNFGNSYLSAWLSNFLVYTLRLEMFKRLLQLPVSHFDDTPAGRVISRVAFDVAAVSSAGFGIITVTVKDGLTVLFLLGYMLWLDWKLSVITLLLLPLIALSIRFASQRIRGLSKAGQEATGDLVHVLEETVHGNRVVRIFGGQAYELGRFDKAAQQIRRLSLKQTASTSINDGTVQTLLSIGIAVIIAFALYRAKHGSLTAGGFVAFITAMTMLIQPLKRMTGINDTLQRGLAAAESVFSFLDAPVEQDRGQHTLTSRPHGHIRFDHLTFRYGEDTPAALDDLSLDIPAGQTVALVGSSGSGKTTTANLIPLFYVPQAGRILLDGVPITDIPLQDLRRHIALVSQDVVLFNDTVAANIAYGQPDASREAIEQAARAAHAYDFIVAMPEGFDTLIGERGLKLSGGQRQRLAIARALLKNAPILILDEATSALDTESERQVQAALENLMKDRTTLVIAHRLSTIEHADQIVVMERGQIVEMGRHPELLAKNGAYAHFHRIQHSQQLRHEER